MRTNNRAEMYYTYAYLREDGTPYYIGKGKGDRAYRKVGKPCATPKDKSKIIQLKTNLTEEEAFNHERYMIFIIGRKDLGTGILLNKSDGGEGRSGYIPTEELKRNQSEKMKGENNPLYGKRGKDSPRYGKKHTQETKDKIRNSLKGKSFFKTHTEETKQKLSKLRKGENNPFYGKKHTEETKQKMKEAAKRRKEKGS
jgi:NUMOD3 motif